MKTKIWKKLKYEICVHEASHSVIANLLGMDVKKIVIDYKNDDAYSMIGIWDLPPIDAVVLMAGWAADVIINKKYDKFCKSYGATGDYHDFKKLKLNKQEIREVSLIVYNTVKKNRKTIVKLAKYLNSIEKNNKVTLGKGKFLKFISINSVCHSDKYKEKLLLQILGI